MGQRPSALEQRQAILCRVAPQRGDKSAALTDETGGEKPSMAKWYYATGDCIAPPHEGVAPVGPSTGWLHLPIVPGSGGRINRPPCITHLDAPGSACGHG